MAAVDKAMERAQKAQKDAAQGQTGLFGLFNEAPAPGRSADDLPNVPDWEEGVRLANEKEVLGFFVSGHPLDKYAEKLRNLTGVITTAEALERKPPERTWGKQSDPADEIQVAGMILGLRVQKSKRDQKLYAQASLEDAAGKIDLICFSRDYERLQGQLKIEAPVLVRGVLMGDDDAASKISVSSIQALGRCAGQTTLRRPHPHQPRQRFRRNVHRPQELSRRRSRSRQSHVATRKERRILRSP